MSTLEIAAPAQLHHLSVRSDAPQALAKFYEDLFEMRRVPSPDGTIALAGGARAIVIVPGTSGELAAAGYAMRDETALAHLRGRLGALAEPASADAAVFFGPDALTVRDPQGRVLAFGVPRTPRRDDPAPARLQHVVFQTTELARMVDFYVSRVGFTISDEVVDDDGRVVTCFLRSDDEHHSLAFFQGSRNAWDHHCYETSCWNDIRDWGDRFAAAHRPMFFGPGRHGPGNNLFFMVNDPDGNRVELSAELERVSAGREPGLWPHSEYTLNSWGRAWIRT